MTATFRLHHGEFDETFIAKLRTMFRDSDVEVVVQEIQEERPTNNNGNLSRVETINKLRKEYPQISSLIGVLKESPDMWEYLLKKYQ